MCIQATPPGVFWFVSKSEDESNDKKYEKDDLDRANVNIMNPMTKNMTTMILMMDLMMTNMTVMIKIKTTSQMALISIRKVCLLT